MMMMMMMIKNNNNDNSLALCLNAEISETRAERPGKVLNVVLQ
jgi:hypothetical protein